MKKLAILIGVLVTVVAVYAENVQVIVNKFPGRTLETHPEFYVDEIKQVTAVSVDDMLTVTESAAALTYSNVTDSVSRMEATAGYVYPTNSQVNTILGSLDAATITNLPNILTAITNNVTY